MTTEQPFTPSFIPAHLRGKVSDFRRLGDGSVSFAHPEGATGTFGPEASRRKIDAGTFAKTFDPLARSRDLESAVNGQYTGPSSDNYVSDIRKWIVDQAGKGWKWGTSSQGKSLATTGILAALAGGGLGAYKALNSGDSVLGKGLLYSLLAGGTAVGATALGQHFHNQQMAKAAGAKEDIVTALTQDPSVSFMDRSAAVQALAALTKSELTELASLLRTALGASLGVLIVRYLKGKGLMPSLAGGIIGAIVGRATAPKPIFNAMGQISTANFAQ